MKRSKGASLFSGLLIGLSSVAEPQAQTPLCPDPPNRVTVRVNADVKYDAPSGVYTYAYTVSNDVMSVQEVKWFSVNFVPPISNIVSPRGWSDGEFYRRSTMGWVASEPADPDSIPDDASVPPSIVQIKPGDTLRGFSFQSPKPPGPAKYYVTGWVPLTVSTGATIAEAEGQAEQRIESCPQLQQHILDQSLVGVTAGPIDAVPVKIDIKPRRFPNRINPRGKGVVSVAILGASTFDVHKVDQSSVTLGLDQAAPKGVGKFQDVNGDRLFDVVFQFRVSETGLQCGDTSLFLTGKTLDGMPFSGVDSIVTVGCKDDDDDDHDEDDDE